MLPPFARILVVDDSIVLRKAVCAMLRELGFANIDEARNGREALSKIAAVRYSLVLSDWFMSPLSGLDLLQHLRRSEDGKRLPFIMITAQKQKKFLEIARDAGATYFLAKPFTSRQLADKIAQLGEPTRSNQSHGRNLRGESKAPPQLDKICLA